MSGFSPLIPGRVSDFDVGPHGRYSRALTKNKTIISNILSKLAEAGRTADRKDIWEGVKLPTKFRCLGYIAEKYGLCPDLQDLLEKTYHKKLTDDGCKDFATFEGDKSLDEGTPLYATGYGWRAELNVCRFIPRSAINLRKGLPMFSGLYHKRPIERPGRSVLILDGIVCTSNEFSSIPRVDGVKLFCEDKRTTWIREGPCQRKTFSGCGKDEIIKALQERKIKFNKNKSKAQLLMILIKSPDV